MLSLWFIFSSCSEGQQHSSPSTGVTPKGDLEIFWPEAGTHTKEHILTVSGSCSPGYPVVFSGSLFGVLPTSCEEQRPGSLRLGTFSKGVGLDWGDGYKTISVSQNIPGVGAVRTSVQVKIDTIAPLVAFDPLYAIYRAITTSGTRITVRGTCESGLKVKFSGDVSRYQSASCTNGEFSTLVNLLDGLGSKTLTAIQVDKAGNEAESSLELILVQNLLLHFGSHSDGDATNQRTIQISGQCTEGLNVEWSGDIEAPHPTPCFNEQFSELIDLDDGDGLKELTVTQNDPSGKEVTATIHLDLDRQPPHLGFNLSLDGSPFNQRVIEVEGFCEDRIVQFSGDIEGTPTTSCVNSAFKSSVTLLDGDGFKWITATETDLARNSMSSDVLVELDRVPPNLIFNQISKTIVKDKNINVSGYCESGLNVVLSGDIESSMTTTCSHSGGEFSTGIILTSEDGVKDIEAKQEDLAGNEESVSLSLTLDTQPPVLTLTTPESNHTSLSRDVTLKGTCELSNNRSVSISGTILNSPITTPCTQGSFRTLVTLESGDGQKEIILTQEDNAGNTGRLRRSIILDLSIELTTQYSDGLYVNERVIPVEGACSEPSENVQLSGDIIATTALCLDNLSFSTSVTLLGADGAKQIIATQANGMGNNQAILNLILDTTPPTLSFISPSNAATITNITREVNVRGSCEVGNDVELSGDFDESPLDVPCLASLFNSPITLLRRDGTKNIQVTQEDTPGNEGSANLSLVLEIYSVAFRSHFNGQLVNSTNIDIGGFCEPDLGVNLSGDIANLTATCSEDGAFLTPVVLTGGDGLKSIIAIQTGASGNIQATLNLILDTIPPVVRFTSPERGTTLLNTNEIIVEGLCENGGTNVTLSGDVTTSKTVACSSSVFQASLTVTDGGGAKSLFVTQRDSAENETRSSLIVSLRKTLRDIVQVSPGGFHTCALTSSGHVKCWGRNESGQLGNGSESWSYLPTSVHTSSTNSAPLNDIKAISSGDSHTCALTLSGHVKCWGDGFRGALGDGRDIINMPERISLTPVDVHTSSTDSSPLSGIAAISVGSGGTWSGSHTCALTTDETVKCWGSGHSGQLGDGGSSSSSTPVYVHTSSSDPTPLSGIKAISSGGWHTCALVSDTIKCWGYGGYGQLGIGGEGEWDDSTLEYYYSLGTPTPLDVHTSSSDSNPLSNIAAVSAGDNHTCALTKGGSVKCWGYGQDDGLGYGISSAPMDIRTSSSDINPLSNISAVSAGSYETCVLTTGGTVKCWRSWGGYPIDVQTSSSDTNPLSGITSINLGRGHACAIATGGSVKCWGEYSYTFALGDGRGVSSTLPVDVLRSREDTPDLSNIKSIDIGDWACALTTGGNVKCWGGMSSSQLPVDTHTSSTDPTPLENIESISVGRGHACAVTTNGTVKCWGQGGEGQLGSEGEPDSNGYYPNSFTPMDVQSSSDSDPLSNITAVSSGEFHTCALTVSGSVECWGGIGRSEWLLGNARIHSSVASVDVHNGYDESILEGVTAISVGSEHTCALTTGGIVKCWGRGSYGRLGNSGSDQQFPVNVLSNATNISAGGYHTCALIANGTVKCWGKGKLGQLGHGSSTHSSTIPVNVSESSSSNNPLSGIAAISAGGYHTCALTTSGVVKCWGYGGIHGALGNGEPGEGDIFDYDSSAPVDVHTSSSDSNPLSNISGISAGRRRTCALTTGGTVKCWGYGELRDLVNGINSSSSTPVNVINP